MTARTWIRNVSASFLPMIRREPRRPVGRDRRDVEADRRSAWAPTSPSSQPCDELALAEHDHGQRFETVVAVVELDAVAAAHADVVDDHRVARLGFRTRAGLDDRDLRVPMGISSGISTSVCRGW